jgi:hypothetical protein
MSIHLLIGIAALVCFGLATFGVQTKINLVALGLVFLTLFFLIA